MKHAVLILIGLLLSTQVQASFTPNGRRYLHPRDLFNVTAQKFPILNERSKLQSGGLEVNCYAIVSSNQNVIGVVNPALGTPAVELPPPGFVRWLGSCGHKIVKLQLDDLSAQQKNDKLWARYWPADILAKYRDTKFPNPYAAFGIVKWSELDASLKKSVLAYSVREMIGPESVIKDLGHVKSLDELTAELDKTVREGATLRDALHDILLAIMLREEFLTY